MWASLSVSFSLYSAGRQAEEPEYQREVDSER